jgi:tRNA threonylcarbamoyladenosine biosynthesis protein TsaB
MNTIGIETSTDYISVALYFDGEYIERTELVPKLHSSKLPSAVREILCEHDISVRAIDRFAVGIGPGSYTGARIGTSFANGFAAGSGVELCGIDSLLAQAFKFRSSTDPVAVIVDARVGQIYCAIFKFTQKIEVLLPSTISTIGEFSIEVAKYDRLVLCGFSAQQFCGVIQSFAHSTEITIPSDFAAPSARCVVELSFENSEQRGFLEPKYMREFVPGIKRK